MHVHESIWRTLIVVLILGLALNGPVTANVAATNPVNPDGGQESQPALASSPVMFIENVGQFAEGARFQVRGGGRTIWLAEDGIWVTLVEPRPAPVPPDGAFASPHYPAARDKRPTERGLARAVAVRLSFVGANPHPTLEPFGRLDTSLNYFIGNEPDEWQTNVPVWSGVRYRNLYPDVDLVLGVDLAPAQAGQAQSLSLPWRLEVRDNADLSAIHLRTEGVDAVELLPSPEFGRGVGGEGLQLTTAVGEFTLPLLAVERLPLEPSTIQRVDVQTHDITAPFTSAPLRPRTYPPLLPSTSAQTGLLYSTFLGGSGTDRGSGIAVDASGRAYVTGRTESTDFPTTPGAYDTTYNGGGGWGDAFVAKLSPDGSALTYATYLGGTSWDRSQGIAVDGSGNAYVTGTTMSSDFPATPGAYDTTYNGDGDAFVAKLSSDGGALAYATFLGGGSSDYGSGIAVDGSGSAYVTGQTESSDFPTTPGAYDTMHNGDTDAFVAKLSPGGNSLVYATFLAGSGDDHCIGIAVDGSGKAYVTGSTESSDFPTTPAAFDTTYNGGDRDAFVAELSPDGSSLVYATFLGGSDWDLGSDIAVDGSGSAYVTGSTLSSDFPTTLEAYDTTFNGGLHDAFVAKLSPDGSALAYSTFLGGTGMDRGQGIAVDGSGHVYVTGFTLSFDFPITPGAYDTTYNCVHCSDAFVTRLSPDGSTLAYSTFLGGTGWDRSHGIDVDGSGKAYVTGSTESSDFPTTAGAYDTSYNGGDRDAFVTGLNIEPTTETASTVYLPLITSASSPSLPSDDMVLIPTGEFPMGCHPIHNGGFDCYTRELPLHLAYLDAYAIDKTPVTNAQYAQCVAAGVCNPPPQSNSSTRDAYYGNPIYADYPVIYVTWHNANAYCTCADKRLPTEAEWEKAARGPTVRAYPWGDQRPNCALANVRGCVGDTSQVESYPAGASPYGVLDLAGNVWEWVNDWYHEHYYGVSPHSNPRGPESGTRRVLRGGAYLHDPLHGFSRGADRWSNSPGNAWDSVGSRCATSSH